MSKRRINRRFRRKHEVVHAFMSLITCDELGIGKYMTLDSWTDAEDILRWEGGIDA